MAVTLNKDGTPRKQGSGKTKGAGCFTNIKWQQLKEFIGENEDIQVSRVWLRSIGALSQKRGSRKKVTLSSRTSTSTKPISKTVNQSLPKSIIPATRNSPVENEEDDYSPPPLFGAGGEIRNY
jgi:hypothetical protein